MRDMTTTPDVSRRGRVLMAGPSETAPGGMRTVAESYIAHWDDQRYNLRYVGTYTDKGNRLTSVWFMVRALARCLWLLLSWRPNIVHVHVSQNLSVVRKGLVALMGRMLGTKVIWHNHGSQFSTYYDGLGAIFRRLVRSVMGLSHVVIALTEQERDYYRKLVPGTRLEILSDPYPPFVAHESPPPSQRGARVLTLGRLGERKGTYDIVSAIPDVLAVCPEAIFTLGGDGEVEQFRAAALEPALANHLLVPGWMAGEVREAAFDEARIFLLPSYAESFGVAVIEAMARGLPVVTTPAGVCAEVIDDGVNGYLIQPGDREALAARVLALLQDGELADRMGARGRETVISRYSIETILPQLYALYDSLIGVQSS